MIGNIRCFNCGPFPVPPELDITQQILRTKKCPHCGAAEQIKGKQVGMLLKECKDIQYAGRFKGVNDAIEFMNRRIVNIIEKQNEKVVDNKNQE